MKDYEIVEFENGIRLVHKQVTNTRIAHCGIIIDVGSRDELPHEAGMAHFWEHMAFKGTTHRKSWHILNSIDKVGGELNAFTTKEKINFHVSVLDTWYDRAVGILADIAFDSIFPEKEIEKERAVILEEMAMYEDAPDDAIQDEFDEVVFANHPLGRNILGTNESVSRFGRDDFNRFIARTVSTDRVILSSVGAFPLATAVKVARKYLAGIPARRQPLVRQPFASYSPVQRIKAKPITQTHVLIGRDAYALNDERRIKLFMLANLLGGPFMNCRLSMSLRERHGLVYSVEANYAPYTDTGQFAIYYATDPDRHQKAHSLVMKELQLLRQVPLGKTQLQTLKEQIMGQLAMSEESNSGLMQMLGKSLLDLGTIESLADIYARINAVTAADLVEVARDMLDETQLSTLVYEPEPEKTRAPRRKAAAVE